MDFMRMKELQTRLRDTNELWKEDRKTERQKDRNGN